MNRSLTISAVSAESTSLQWTWKVLNVEVAKA